MTGTQDGLWLADGGIETDLIFYHGRTLPEFAAFVLLDEPAGGCASRCRRSGWSAAAAAPTSGTSAPLSAADCRGLGQPGSELTHWNGAATRTR